MKLKFSRFPRETVTHQRTLIEFNQAKVLGHVVKLPSGGWVRLLFSIKTPLNVLSYSVDA